MIKKYNGIGSLNTKTSASRRWSMMITKYKGTLISTQNSKPKQAIKSDGIKKKKKIHIQARKF